MGELEKSKRISSIEATRFIAAFAVVLLHYFPFTGTLKLIIDETARFAVPFFFCASGYFLTQKLNTNNHYSTFFNPIKKLAGLYLIWQIIYFFNPIKDDIKQFGIINAYYQKVNYLLNCSIEDLLFCGFGFHLWFLTSLLFTILFYFILGKNNLKLLLIISIILYLFGVIANSYSVTPIGISIPFNTRNFIFFSALPFFMGAYASHYQFKIKSLTAYSLTIIGFIGHYFEAWYLRVYYNTDIMDYGFSTFLMGFGVFLIALLEPFYLKSNLLSKLGSLTTGIYCVHILIGSRIIEDFNYDFSSNFNKILLPISVLFFASLISFIFKKAKYLKMLV